MIVNVSVLHKNTTQMISYGSNPDLSTRTPACEPLAHRVSHNTLLGTDTEVKCNGNVNENFIFFNEQNSGSARALQTLASALCETTCEI